MKNQKQKILAVVLLGVVLLVVGALVYVSTRLAQPTAIAPTAPQSEPMAAVIAPGIDDRCQVSFTITPPITTTITTTPTATPTASITATPSATPVVTAEITIDKTAFQDESENTPGNYDLQQEISTVSKNQTFVYTIVVENTSTVSASGIQIKDTLNGPNQDLLAFKDNENSCTYTASDKTVTCNTSLSAGEVKSFSFRTTVSDTAVNGTVIENTARVTFDGEEQRARKDLVVNTIVSCNHTCTTDEQCGDGLVCDTESSKCRNSACLSSENCVCPTATPVRPLATATPRPPQPTVLPEAGILDLAGVAAFGGGLLLAVIGILLAL